MHDEETRRRFWSKVEKADGCWIWTRAKNEHGYGLIGVVAGRSALAHRVAWELTHGPIPDGLCVLHRCDVRACVRPSHLWLGTQQDNVADCAAKGRQSRPRGERNAAAKLTATDVEAVRTACASGEVQHRVGRRMGITQGQVSKIVRGACWAHLHEEGQHGGH